jgi:uncharacterized protein YukJ
MPVPQYGVLKGRPTARQVRGPHNRPPHLHVSLSAGGSTFDIAVNILSTDGSEILYHVNHAFAPPHAAELLGLPPGRTLLPGGNPLALDYVRQGIVKPDDMTLLKAQDALHLTASDLHNEIDDMVVRAINDPQAQFFAFGSEFPEGIHDIHMNQGNPAGGAKGPDFSQDNGTFQDGALMVLFPRDARWLAAFLAFQSQSWTTDADGDPA